MSGKYGRVNQANTDKQTEKNKTKKEERKSMILRMRNGGRVLGKGATGERSEKTTGTKGDRRFMVEKLKEGGGLVKKNSI